MRPPRYAPAPLLPRGRRNALRRLADGNVAAVFFTRPTRSHAHRCSRLTRQNGGEQSGLVALTFDLLTLTVVSESHVTPATCVPILVFIGPLCSRLRPDVRDRRQTDRRQTSDRRQTDVRQHHRFMPRLLGAGDNNFLYNLLTHCHCPNSVFAPAAANRPWRDAC